MLIVLILRLSLTKEEKGPDHQLDKGFILYDPNYGSSHEFFSYSRIDPVNYVNTYCKDRGYGPDRTLIALAPSSSAIMAEVKTTLESDLSGTGMTVELFASRDSIMNVIRSPRYEKDGVSGI